MADFPEGVPAFIDALDDAISVQDVLPDIPQDLHEGWQEDVWPDMLEDATDFWPYWHDILGDVLVNGIRSATDEPFFNNWIDEDVDELCHKLQSTSTLNDLTVKFSDNAHFEKLVAALAENQSLKKLNVDLTRCEDSPTESMVSTLCMAISRHPEMSSLTILAAALGENSSEAIIDLIRFCRLQELRVGNRSTAPQHCASKLVKALEENQRLKILAIPRIGGLTFPDFMTCVLKSPRMECVSLLSMGDTSNDDIHAVAKMPIRQEPFTWEVGWGVDDCSKQSACQKLKREQRLKKRLE